MILRISKLLGITLFLIGCNHDADENHVLAYIDDGAVQCESDGLSADQTAQILIDDGIDVMLSHCGYLSGIAVAAQCGLGNTNINLHTINIQNIYDARELGFEPVSSLKHGDDIGYVIIECPNQT